MSEENQCPCHNLILPRWDIYICDYCGRQLAWLEPKFYSWWDKVKWHIKMRMKGEWKYERRK